MWNKGGGENLLVSCALTEPTLNLPTVLLLNKVLLYIKFGAAYWVGLGTVITMYNSALNSRVREAAITDKGT